MDSAIVTRLRPRSVGHEWTTDWSAAGPDRLGGLRVAV